MFIMSFQNQKIMKDPCVFIYSWRRYFQSCGIVGPCDAREPGYSPGRCGICTLGWRWQDLRCTCLLSRCSRWRIRWQTMYQMREMTVKRSFCNPMLKYCEEGIQRGITFCQWQGGWSRRAGAKRSSEGLLGWLLCSMIMANKTKSIKRAGQTLRLSHLLP